MSDEIRLSFETGKTLKAQILLLAAMWDGSAMVDPATLSSAEWTAGLVECTEQTTSGDGDGMGLYLADFPGALSLLAEYSVVFFEGASPAPEAIPKATQGDPTEYRHSSVTVTAMTQAALAQFITDDTGETAAVDGSVAKISQGTASIGSGALVVTITTKTDGGVPLDGVEVWITSDAAGNNVVAGTVCSDAAGLTTFMLDAATYYVWKQLAGYDFTNPTAIVVSA